MSPIGDSQLTIHGPSDYLRIHWQQFLPDWNQPLRSVILYLQRSPVRLCERTKQTEIYKTILREQFLKLGVQWCQILQQKGFEAELFDPKFGTPLLSQAGQKVLDDVALVHALLQYPVVQKGECWVLKHPTWKTAVFPATLLSSASPEVVQTLLPSNQSCPI